MFGFFTNLTDHLNGVHRADFYSTDVQAISASNPAVDVNPWPHYIMNSDFYWSYS